MTSRDNVRDAILGRLDAANSHDIARVREAYAEDCVIESPLGGGTVLGRAATAALDAAWAGAFRDATFRTDELIVDGDRAAWMGRAEGTWTGEFMGLPPTGTPFSVPMALVSTFRGSEVAHERRVYDFTGMLIQLGILRARPSNANVSHGRADAPPPGRGAAAAAPPGSRETIAALLARRRQAWRARDVSTLVEQHADGCVMDSHLEGRVAGVASVAHVYGLWFEAFPDSTLVEDGPPIVEGDRAAECAVLSGTDTGGFLGLPATRRPFHLPCVWWYAFSDRQLSYVRPVYDFTGMLVQIGLLKAKPV